MTILFHDRGRLILKSFRPMPCASSSISTRARYHTSAIRATT
jgi:hypothetical protein